MKKYNLYLPEQQIETLNLLSEQKGLSVSEIIRRALDEYIEKESNKNQSSEKLQNTKRNNYAFRIKK